MHCELEFRVKWKFFFNRLDVNSISQALYTNYFSFHLLFCIPINDGVHMLLYISTVAHIFRRYLTSVTMNMIHTCNTFNESPTVRQIALT